MPQQRDSWRALAGSLEQLQEINLVERWFAEIANKRIRRGVFRSVKELEAAIREYIDVHNENPKPFVWTRNRGPNPGEHRPFRSTYLSFSTRQT